MLSSTMLLIVSLYFFPSLIILTFYFSSILTGNSARRTFYKSGFVISFAGLAIGAMVDLVAPILPDFISFIDGTLFTIITWILLLKHYYGTGWLETLPPIFLATIVYVVILAGAAAFSILLLKG